jgi:hypothetical protein
MASIPEDPSGCGFSTKHIVQLGGGGSNVRFAVAGAIVGVERAFAYQTLRVTQPEELGGAGELNRSARQHTQAMGID